MRFLQRVLDCVDLDKLNKVRIHTQDDIAQVCDSLSNVFWHNLFESFIENSTHYHGPQGFWEKEGTRHKPLNPV